MNALNFRPCEKRFDFPSRFKKTTKDTKMTAKLASLICVCLFSSLPNLHAADTVTERQKKLQEVSKLDAELKPLRIRATTEPEVIAARKEADEALRRYYEIQRVKMGQLDPKMKSKINRHVRLRKEVHGGSAGSRAEDYMEAAAKKRSSTVSTNTP